MPQALYTCLVSAVANLTTNTFSYTALLLVLLISFSHLRIVSKLSSSSSSSASASSSSIPPSSSSSSSLFSPSVPPPSKSNSHLLLPILSLVWTLEVMYLLPTLPTDTFTTLELQNPSRDVPELHKNCRSPNFEALELSKGWSGYCFWGPGVSPPLFQLADCLLFAFPLFKLIIEKHEIRTILQEVRAHVEASLMIYYTVRTKSGSR